jgi:LuxR family maltose regulon positive regulatory protein
VDNAFLVTKLQIPSVTRRTVNRPRLLETLEGAIPRSKLVLLAAPAGYGKTTLLSQWARSSRLPVAWLSVDGLEDDVGHFLLSLLASWEVAQPSIREGPLGLLLDAMSPEPGTILATFLNAVNDVPGSIVFVLDDYHLIEDPAIHDAMSFLLAHLPPNLNFVLACRGEPPLPLARYRARGEMFEIRAEELGFSMEETEGFMNEVMGLGLAEDKIARLHYQLEGWIAGLQLVALALQKRRTAPDELSISGRHRLISDFLGEDVLASLPTDVRGFLFQTSILDRLSGPLCNAVTRRQDGQEMLELLERESLFLVPLDDERSWFRYHRLFGEYLREELVRQHPGDVTELHRSAALWYLSNDLPEQAFRHALEGESVDLAAQIVERHFPVKLMTGEVQTMKRWLDALPETWSATRPIFGLAQAFFLALAGDFEGCIRWLDRVEERLLPADTEQGQRQMARATAGRCLVACLRNDLPGAEAYANRALRNLADADVFYRAGIHHSLGDLYRQNGRWQDARSHYRQVLKFTSHPSAHFRRAHIYGALADLDLEQGHLRDAADNWRKALAAIREPESRRRIPLPVSGWVHIRLGEILLEWNELAEAWQHLSRGLERAELGGDVRSMIAGYLMAGRLKLAERDLEAAADYLDKTRPLVASARFPQWLRRFERVRLELWLARGRLRAAARWSDEILGDGGPGDRPAGARMQLALVRVLIVKGDTKSVERALTMLGPLLWRADEEGRAGIQIEGLALRALAHWRRGDGAGAMTALEHALRLAEPEGYMRLFLDLGLPMARLLQEAHSRSVVPDYVETLLEASDTELLPPESGKVLLEPLTDREQEVLELMAAGLRNHEIAEKLVISPGTVKKHASNIYGKWGVHSRTEAAAKARELGLLEHR